MHKALLILFLGLMASVALHAQQFPQYSLFGLNKYAYNPAYAGMDESLSLTGVYRAQWVNLEGAPTTQHINMHLPLYFLNGGLGLKFENEEIGAYQQWTIGGSYNQFISLGGEGVLSTAISGQFMNRSLDGSLLRSPEGLYNDGNLQHNDDLLSESLQSGTAFSVGVALYLEWKGLEAGLSAMHVNEPVYDFGFAEGRNNFQEVAHYFMHLGYNFPVGEVLEAYPYALVKSDGVQTQAELALQLTYAGTFFAGGGMRGWNEDTMDAALIFAGARLNPNFTIAYNYDFPLSELQNAHDGTHEFLINYNLNRPIGQGRPPKVIYNPRFL